MANFVNFAWRTDFSFLWAGSTFEGVDCWTWLPSDSDLIPSAVVGVVFDFLAGSRISSSKVILK